MYCCWGSSYHGGKGWDRINLFNPPRDYPKPCPGFPTSHVTVFLCPANSVKVRDDCSFCWYWWNWRPSLFKFPFHYMNIVLAFKEISANRIVKE